MGRSVHSWNVRREFPCFLKVQIDVSDRSSSVSEIIIKPWSCLACGKVPTDVKEKKASETMTHKGGLEQKWDEVLPPASLQSLLGGGKTVVYVLDYKCQVMQLSSSCVPPFPSHSLFGLGKIWCLCRAEHKDKQSD